MDGENHLTALNYQSYLTDKTENSKRKTGRLPSGSSFNIQNPSATYSYSTTVKQLRLGFITRDLSVILIPSAIYNEMAAIAVVIRLLSMRALI